VASCQGADIAKRAIAEAIIYGASEGYPKQARNQGPVLSGLCVFGVKYYPTNQRGIAILSLFGKA